MSGDAPEPEGGGAPAAEGVGAVPRRRTATGLLVLGGGLVLVGSFLPWLISGSARRDSYATVRVAQRLGVVGWPVWEALLSVWFVTPLLVALVGVALAFDRRRAVPLVGVPLGLIALVVAGVVLVAPVERGVGPVVVACGAVAVLIGSVMTARRARAATRGRSVGGTDRQSVPDF